ncbi:MAG: helix-turn-helix domain-containing protein [Halobacteria archaeon]
MAPDSTSPLQRLLDLGLTEYQAKVYLALLKAGAATASQLTSLCDVPRTRIYPTMEQLHEKGLANVLPETPIRYRPVPIGDYLERRAREMRSRADEMDALKGTYAEAFAIRGQVTPAAAGSFEVHRGRDNAREKLLQMWGRARKSIEFVGSGHAPPRLLGKLYTTARERRQAGAKVRFIFPLKTPHMERVKSALSDFDVRFSLEVPPVDVCVTDGREVILIHRIPDDPDPYKGEDAAIWTDDPAIGEARTRLFESFWRDASSPEHPTLAMVPAALRDWLEVEGVKPKLALEGMARNLGTQLGASMKSETVSGILKELNSIFTETDIANVGKGKGNRVFVRCRYHDITGACPEYDTFCRTLLQTVFRERLGPDAVSEITHTQREGCSVELK